MLNYFVRFIRLDGDNKVRFENHELYINLGSAQRIPINDYPIRNEQQYLVLNQAPRMEQPMRSERRHDELGSI